MQYFILYLTFFSSFLFISLAHNEYRVLEWYFGTRGLLGW